MKKQPDPKLRDGIIEATATASALANQARLDGTLPTEARDALARAWEMVVRALMDSPTPDPAMPAFQAIWKHRKPLIQAMVDAIRAAEKGARGHKVTEVCIKLKAELDELQAKLNAGNEPVTVEINFGQSLPNYLTGADERAAFARYAHRQVELARKAGLCR